MDGMRLIRRVGFLKATRRVTGRYRRSVSGATALEFGLIMPVFLLLVFAIIETSVYYYKQSHLKFILSQAGRHIQTGEIQKSATPKADFDAEVCDNSKIFFDCTDVYLDVRNFGTVADVSFPAATFNSAGKPTNFVFQPGGSAKITAMRASAIHSFITPFLKDILQPDGDPVILVGFTIFKNEPF
ncbi:MAG: hypothetical protein CL534_21205 [Ahrensia sp.]|nr:hypothetical protein [Ahrensia sp.]